MSWAMWITGPPGSGKSVLARRVADVLRTKGSRVRVLELDEVRQSVTPDALYDPEEREVVYRSLIVMATELVAAGVPVIIDATGHRRAWRELARERIGRFAEVQLECPVQVCRGREVDRHDSYAPRGLDARAGRPGATVPAVDVPYEPAVAPELRLRTDQLSRAIMIQQIVEVAAAWAVPTAAVAEGCVVWITGRPGTGKTTLARALDQALAARGVESRLIGLSELKSTIQAERLGAARGPELAHRALGYIAKLLAEAGVLVVVDGGPSRRAWRDAARRISERFIEVELTCDPAVSAERDRAARWGLWLARAPGLKGAIEAGPPATEHEPAAHPEVSAETGVQSVDSAVADVLRAIVTRLGPALADRVRSATAADTPRCAERRD